MTIPEYFYCENKKALPGAGLILHTAPPCHIAKVFRFDNREEMEYFINKYELKDKCGKVAGYYILLCHIGNIDRVQEYPIRGSGITDKVISILKMMASFYYEEKIINNETRLKKHKEQAQ